MILIINTIFHIHLFIFGTFGYPNPIITKRGDAYNIFNETNESIFFWFPKRWKSQEVQIFFDNFYLYRWNPIWVLAASTTCPQLFFCLTWIPDCWECPVFMCQTECCLKQLVLSLHLNLGLPAVLFSNRLFLQCYFYHPVIWCSLYIPFSVFVILCVPGIIVPTQHYIIYILIRYCSDFGS